MTAYCASPRLIFAQSCLYANKVLEEEEEAKEELTAMPHEARSMHKCFQIAYV
jgi:hypothetical protein